MKIVICSSMKFAKEMMKAKKELESLGHEVEVPKNTDLYASQALPEETRKESAINKIQGDLIRRYFNIIKEADAVLALNLDKEGISNYIGGNSLMELAFAHVLNKKVFLLNDIPNMSYRDELIALQPTVLKGDLRRIN